MLITDLYKALKQRETIPSKVVRPRTTKRSLRARCEALERENEVQPTVDSVLQRKSAELVFALNSKDYNRAEQEAMNIASLCMSIMQWIREERKLSEPPKVTFRDIMEFAFPWFHSSEEK